MAPDPQSGTRPVRLRHRSLNLPTWRKRKTQQVESLPRPPLNWEFESLRRHFFVSFAARQRTIVSSGRMSQAADREIDDFMTVPNSRPAWREARPVARMT